MVGSPEAHSELQNGKPWIHIYLDNRPPTVMIGPTNPTPFSGPIIEWLQDKSGVLNIAGSRESKHPGIQQLVHMIMIDVLNVVNGFRVYPISDEG